MLNKYQNHQIRNNENAKTPKPYRYLVLEKNSISNSNIKKKKSKNTK